MGREGGPFKLALSVCLLLGCELWAQGAASDAYEFVSMFGNPKSVYADETGGPTTLGSSNVGTVRSFATPTFLVGQSSDGGVLLEEWSNLALAGREFADRPEASAMEYKFFASGEAADVVMRVNGVTAIAFSVSSGGTQLLSGSGFTHHNVEFSSTADLVCTHRTAGAAFMPMPPMAQTILGQCSPSCEIHIFGGDNTVALTRACTNGTVTTVHPGGYSDDIELYTGATCRWTAPDGYRISGRAKNFGIAGEGTAFVSPDLFQLITPLPVDLAFMLLISQGPAVCTYDGDKLVSLAGASGVHHARLEGIAAGTVFQCDQPVTAIGDALCPGYFDTPCTSKNVNVIAAPVSGLPTGTSPPEIASTATYTTLATTLTATQTMSTTTTATSATMTATTTATATTVTTTATSATMTATTMATATTVTTTATSATMTATTMATATTVTTTATSATMTATTTATATTVTETPTSATMTATTTATATTVTTTTASATVTATTLATATTVTATTTSATVTATTLATATTVTTRTTSATVTATTLATATTVTETTATSTSSRTTSTTLALTPTTVTPTTTATFSSTTTATPTATASTTTASATPAGPSSSSAVSTSSTAAAATSGPGTSAPAEVTTTAPADDIPTDNEVAPADSLLDLVGALEAALLAAFLEGNHTRLTMKEAGYTLVAVRLDAGAFAAAGGALPVFAEDTGVAVAVPASLFSGLEEEAAVLLLTAFGPDNAGSMSTGEPSLQVWDAVNLNVFSYNGSKHEVHDLVEPIRIVLPVEPFGGLECAFWSEDHSSWDSFGLLLEPAAGLVTCEASHMTLFAAIARGFASTFACSQVKLLSGEALEDLARFDWCFTPGALMLWGLLMAFLSLLLVAAWVDWHRWNEGFDDEHLLIPTDTKANARSQLQEVEEEEEEADGRASNGTDSIGREAAQRWLCVCVGTSYCSWFVGCCHESSAMRDALDEVVSQWVDHFAELRDFFEGLGEGLECSSGCSGEDSCGFILIHQILSATLAMSARRQAAGSVGVSSDVACLLAEDEDMGEVVQAHKDRTKLQLHNHVISERSDRSVSEEGAGWQDSEEEPVPWHARASICEAEPAWTEDADAPEASNSQAALRRAETWGELHRRMEHKLDSYFEAFAKWSSLPGTMWRLFLVQNPFGACLVHDAFTSSKLRVLFLMVDQMSSLMLATIFFAASGVPGKRSRNTDCTFDDPFELIGRMMAIGTGSMIIGGIPAVVLGSLCTRGIKKVDYEGCPEWHRQLRAWKTQDKIVWFLGVSYLGFCTFFVCLFLSNVAQRDHGSWLLSGLISVVEDTVAIPLAVAMSLPLLCALCLAFLSSHRRVRKEELISERNIHIKRKWNMASAIGTV